MVARVAPEKRLSLGASSNPIFCQLTEVVPLEALVDDVRLGVVAETVLMFFDSLAIRCLVTRALPAVFPRAELLLREGDPVDLAGV